MSLQLDNQRIAIRERNLLEIMDLALAVIRTSGLPLVAALAVGVVPMLLLNDVLIGHLSDDWFLEDDFEMPFMYLYWMVLLVVIETPLAAAPATLYLGKFMFQEHPDLRQMAGDFLRSLPQIILFQSALRVLLVTFSFLLIPPLIPYWGWPYLNEIILLERNPLRSGKTRRTTTLRRARTFHTGMVGDSIGRWITSAAIGLVLILSVMAAAYILLSYLTGRWHVWHSVYRFYLPSATWIVLSFFTVVRFLCYLDLRIRREGWEVELALRAEAARLTRQPA